MALSVLDEFLELQDHANEVFDIEVYHLVRSMKYRPQLRAHSEYMSWSNDVVDSLKLDNPSKVEISTSPAIPEETEEEVAKEEVISQTEEEVPIRKDRTKTVFQKKSAEEDQHRKLNERIGLGQRTIRRLRESSIYKKIKQKSRKQHVKEDIFKLIEPDTKELDGKIFNINYRETFPLTFTVEESSLSMLDNIRNNSDVLYWISHQLFPEGEENQPKFGAPVAMSCYASKHLLFATSKSQIVVFDLATKKSHILGTPKPEIIVTTMDISSDGQFIVTGYNDRSLRFWSIKGGSRLAVVRDASEASVVCARFWKGNSSVVISDKDGNVNVVHFTKGFFSWDHEWQALLKKDDVFHAIEVLKPPRANRNYRHIALEHSTIAMASENVVLVISMEPRTQVVFTLYQPFYVEATKAPFISWGYGALPNDLENKDPLLCVVWGFHIMLLRVRSLTRKKSSTELEEIGEAKIGVAAHYISNDSVVHCSFLSHSLLFTITAERGANLLFTGNLHPGEHVFNSEINQDKNLVLRAQVAKVENIYVSSLTHPVLMTNDEMGSPEDGISPYAIDILGNSLAVNESSFQLFFLEKERLVGLRLLPWEEYIDEVVKENLWIEAMHLIFEIQRGKVVKFADIPLQQVDRRRRLGDKTHSIVMSFMKTVICHVEEGEEVCLTPGMLKKQQWISRLNYVFDLLTLIDDYTFLFDSVGDLMINHFKNNTFYDALEPFILNRKIKVVPETALKPLIAHYVEARNSPNIAEFLLLNLRLCTENVDPVIKVCIDFRLYVPLFIISIRVCEDINTPLVAIFSQLRQKYLVPGASLPPKPLAEVIPKTCLHFLKTCIEGNLPHGENIKETVYVRIIRQLAAWLAEKDNFSMLLAIDVYYAFETLLLLPKPKPKSALIGSTSVPLPSGQLLLSMKEGSQAPVDLLNLFNQVLQHVDAIGHFGSVGNGVSGGENEKLRFSIAHFIATISTFNMFVILKEVVIKMIQWLLLRPMVAQQIFLFEDYQPAELALLTNNIIVTLIQYVGPILAKDELAMITGAASTSPFSQAYALLHSQGENYLKCMEVFLSAKHEIIQKRVFDWLEDIIPKLEANHKAAVTKDLIDKMIERLPDLVKLDSERTQKLVSTHYKMAEKHAVKVLAPFPQLQLQYLERILADRNQGASIDDELLILHVKLLCKVDRKKLARELYNHNYPLQEALSICEEAQAYLPQVVILERLGFLTRAMEIHGNHFNRKVAKYVDKIEQGHRAPWEKLRALLQMAMDLCKRIFGSDREESERLWFQLLDIVINANLQYLGGKKLKIKFNDTMKNYRDLLRRLFDEMGKVVDQDKIVDRIEILSGDLLVSDMRRSFESMVQTAQNDTRTLRNIAAMLVGDLVVHNTTVLEKLEMGIPVRKSLGDICPFCKLSTLEQTREEKVAFLSGDVCHLSCVIKAKDAPVMREPSFQAWSVAERLKTGGQPQSKRPPLDKLLRSRKRSALDDDDDEGVRSTTQNKREDDFLAARLRVFNAVWKTNILNAAQDYMQKDQNELTYYDEILEGETFTFFKDAEEILLKTMEEVLRKKGVEDEEERKKRRKTSTSAGLSRRGTKRENVVQEEDGEGLGEKISKGMENTMDSISKGVEETVDRVILKPFELLTRPVRGVAAAMSDGAGFLGFNFI